MTAPAGVDPVRWDAVVAAAVGRGTTAAAADTWLGLVWQTMRQGDEVQGRAAAHARVRGWLEARYPQAPTFPRALELAVGHG